MGGGENVADSLVFALFGCPVCRCVACTHVEVEKQRVALTAIERGRQYCHGRQCKTKIEPKNGI